LGVETRSLRGCDGSSQLLFQGVPVAGGGGDVTGKIGWALAGLPIGCHLAQTVVNPAKQAVVTHPDAPNPLIHPSAQRVAVCFRLPLSSCGSSSTSSALTINSTACLIRKTPNFLRRFWLLFTFAHFLACFKKATTLCPSCVALNASLTSRAC
jgi:hypothetical protein